VVESTGTAQTGGSGRAGCSRRGKAGGILRMIRGTGIVRCSASADGDAGLMLQTVGSMVGEWKLRVDNYTDSMGKERCWRVSTKDSA
jgi:hypothetical protein